MIWTGACLSTPTTSGPAGDELRRRHRLYRGSCSVLYSKAKLKSEYGRLERELHQNRLLSTYRASREERMQYPESSAHEGGCDAETFRQIRGSVVRVSGAPFADTCVDV